jgi:hypothetical protein
MGISSAPATGAVPLITNSTLLGQGTLEDAVYDSLCFAVVDGTCSSSYPASGMNFEAVKFYKYQSQLNVNLGQYLFPFYTGTIGVGPQSTALVGNVSGVGFDLRLNTSTSSMNLGGVSSDYASQNFTNHLLG